MLEYVFPAVEKIVELLVINIKTPRKDLEVFEMSGPHQHFPGATCRRSPNRDLRGLPTGFPGAGGGQRGPRAEASVSNGWPGLPSLKCLRVPEGHKCRVTLYEKHPS